MQINGTGQTAQMPQYKLGHETGRRRQLKTICRNQNEISKAQAVAASQRKVEQLWPEKPGKIRENRAFDALQRRAFAEIAIHNSILLGNSQ